jgi:hypothetical protein
MADQRNWYGKNEDVVEIFQKLDKHGCRELKRKYISCVMSHQKYDQSKADECKEAQNNYTVCIEFCQHLAAKGKSK